MEKISTSTSPFEDALFAAELGDAPFVDLHGCTIDQAVHQLDQFLNHEFVSGTEAVKVVHGRGSGKMREAIHHFLKTQKLVAAFRDSNAPGEQGGVTIAALHSPKNT